MSKVNYLIGKSSWFCHPKAPGMVICNYYSGSWWRFLSWFYSDKKVLKFDTRLVCTGIYPDNAF